MPKKWEKLLLNKDKPDGSYILRISDSAYGVKPYEFGWILGRISKLKNGHTLSRTTYPNTLESLVRAVQKLGHDFDGEMAKGIDEAIKGTVRASTAAVELSQHLREVIDEVKDAA